MQLSFIEKALFENREKSQSILENLDAAADVAEEPEVDGNVKVGIGMVFRPVHKAYVQVHDARLVLFLLHEARADVVSQLSRLSDFVQLL